MIYLGTTNTITIETCRNFRSLYLTHAQNRISNLYFLELLSEWTTCRGLLTEIIKLTKKFRFSFDEIFNKGKAWRSTSKRNSASFFDYYGFDLRNFWYILHLHRPHAILAFKYKNKSSVGQCMTIFTDVSDQIQREKKNPKFWVNRTWEQKSSITLILNRVILFRNASNS